MSSSQDPVWISEGWYFAEFTGHVKHRLIAKKKTPALSLEFLTAHGPVSCRLEWYTDSQRKRAWSILTELRFPSKTCEDVPGFAEVVKGSNGTIQRSSFPTLIYVSHMPLNTGFMWCHVSKVYGLRNSIREQTERQLWSGVEIEYYNGKYPSCVKGVLKKNRRK